MDSGRLEAVIHERTNVVRQSYDLTSLALDPDLAPVARYHSYRMADAGRMFHEAPDGETLSDRLQKLGYDALSKARGQPFCHECGADLRAIAAPNYCSFCGSETFPAEEPAGVSGENLAYVGYAAPKRDLPSVSQIAETVVEGWLDSPGHRQNLLDSRFERQAIGVALTKHSGTGVYITQHLS